MSEDTTETGAHEQDKAPANVTALRREEQIIEAWFAEHVEPLLDIGTPLRNMLHAAKDKLKSLI